jgi:hypothetical protein
MLSQSTIDTIRRLLDEDELTQREIARYAGVSRGTVQAIGDGTLANRKRRRQAAPLVPQLDDEEPASSEPPQRCPGCGGMVYMPCRRCEMWRWPARQAPAEAEDNEPMLLTLRPAERQRYQEIRRLRAVGRVSNLPAAASRRTEFIPFLPATQRNEFRSTTDDWWESPLAPDFPDDPDDDTNPEP